MRDVRGGEGEFEVKTRNRKLKSAIHYIILYLISDVCVNETLYGYHYLK